MIYRNKWEIELSDHAIRRAIERNIHPDMVIATIKGGIIEEFGKNNVRFIKKYKRGTVICVGTKRGGNKIDILTIE
jgi:hypothetical protein